VSSVRRLVFSVGRISKSMWCLVLKEYGVWCQRNLVFEASSIFCWKNLMSSVNKI